MTTPASSRLGPVPIYQQIRAELEVELGSDRWQPHQRFHSESELTSRFDVSRMTVRQALGELVRSGLLYRRAGMGTYVAEPVTPPLGSLTGFAEKLHHLGVTVHTQVLGVTTINPTSATGPAARLRDSGVILHVRRLRTAGNRPVAIHDAWMPYDRCGALQTVDLSGSLSAALRDVCGIHLARTEEEVAARPASTAETELLDHGGAVLQLDSAAFDVADTLVRVTRGVYAGDRVTFTFRTT